MFNNDYFFKLVGLLYYTKNIKTICKSSSRKILILNCRTVIIVIIYAGVL